MKKWVVGLWMLVCMMMFGFTSFAVEEMKLRFEMDSIDYGNKLNLYLDDQGNLWYEKKANSAPELVLDQVEWMQVWGRGEFF